MSTIVQEMEQLLNDYWNFTLPVIKHVMNKYRLILLKFTSRYQL